MSLIGNNVEEKMWYFFKSKGLNDYGAASLMGNIFAESGLNPKNLENSYEIKFGMTDDEYCAAVDNRSYTSFITDCAGWGICQWTYHTRKKALYEHARMQNASIGSLEMQLNFLYKELSENYKSVLTVLKTAKSIKEASNAVLLKFECPADQSISVQNKRISYGQNYYDKYTNEVRSMSFKMRTSKPEAGNKYYITKANGGYSNAVKGKPTDPDCDVLSNCVGYAYGRFNEIGGYGYCKYLSPTNAENFMKHKGGLKVGQTPKVGACMVWQKGNTLSGSDGAGHVAIVEKVISNTEVYTSESGWNASKPFWNQTRKKGNGNWGQNSSYKFLGFIYNPAPCCNDNDNDLAVDGKWGTATTKRLQQIFGTSMDGEISNQWKKYASTNPGLTSGWEWKDKPNGKGSQLIRAMQKWAEMPASDQDGEIGPMTIKAFQAKLGTTIDGKVSSPSQMVKALQKWANQQ